MSVLEVGSGIGDVAMIAAGIVGPAGRVLGVERDPGSVERARDRAATEDLTHITYRTAGLDEFDTDERFDALVGRFVLQYLPDPAATLRRLSRFVRPGGIVVFHDMDFADTNVSTPPCSLWDECYGLLASLFAVTGLPADFGRHLYKVFLDAGLPAPSVDMRGLSGGRPGSAVFSGSVSAIEAIVPVLERAGVAVPKEVTGDGTLSAALDRAAQEQTGQHGPGLRHQARNPRAANTRLSEENREELSRPHSGLPTTTATLAHSLRRAGVGVLAITSPRSPRRILSPTTGPALARLAGVVLADDQMTDELGLNRAEASTHLENLPSQLVSAPRRPQEDPFTGTAN